VQGHEAARFELGACYAHGWWGGPPDMELAARWWGLAAEQVATARPPPDSGPPDSSPRPLSRTCIDVCPMCLPVN
jgi:hypothetical protein